MFKFKILLVIAFVGNLFVGCAGTNPNVSSSNTNHELKDAPKWVMNPFVKGYITELGSASKNAGNDFSFQREEAMANARDNLAKQISTKTSNMFKSFKAATGSGTSATFDKSSETVSKQIASQTLSGSRVQDTWISNSGTLYILMVLDTKAVENMMEESVKTSFKNDKALYQKFFASKAQGELTSELEKLNK